MLPSHSSLGRMAAATNHARDDATSCTVRAFAVMPKRETHSLHTAVPDTRHRRDACFAPRSLQKIQKLHQSLLSDGSMRSLMSPSEFKFCKGYTDLLGKHFNSCVLQRLPESLRDMAKENMILKPPVDNHVFVKVIEELGEAIDIESEAVEMGKDETFVVRFRYIERLVAENKLQLV